MRRLKKIFFVFSIIILAGCGTKKNNLFNRRLNALVTKYNVLFNGQQSFNKGIKEIREKHKDDFSQRLSIEPITFNELKIIGPKLKSFNEGEKSISFFDKAEEKAVKAIQKYSMNFDGYEKNSQIDDAYLLLGKSRYYTQRFIPAIEAYNYIIANYPGANLNYETRVWRAKANIRIGNEDTAIESMKLLMKIVDQKENIPYRIREEAHTAMAMAYSQTDTIQKVIQHLKQATKTSYDKQQFARNMFILGQIYNELDRKDSARIVFEKLSTNFKIPDKYRIHSNIELVKSLKQDSINNVSMIKRFKKLIKDTDNRKYYDELYYQIGTLYKKTKNIKKAIEFYKKSISLKKGNKYQKTYPYEALGNIYFEKSKFLIAGSYYDTVLQIVPKEFAKEKRIRRIKRKNKGLIKLKKYEDIVKNNDSILELVSMNDEKRISFFNNYIKKIKKEDEELSYQMESAKNTGNSLNAKIFFNNTNKGKWYFYNIQSKQFGKAEFKRIWGDRILKDNWRWSDKSTIKNLLDNETLNKVKNENRYMLSTYIDKIPTDVKKINKLKTDRNKALYELGLIYKEQFKNLNTSIKKLERLKLLNKNKDLELPIEYHLYQNYSKTGNKKKSEKSKSFILNNYPFSKFADILKSSKNKKIVKHDEDDIVKKYKELYHYFKTGNYKKVVNEVVKLSKIIKKSELIPKFALLKALSIGKYKSKIEFLEALEFLEFNYPNTIEGKKAKKIINLLKK